MKLKTIDHAILALLEREGATKDNPYVTSNRKTAEAIGCSRQSLLKHLHQLEDAGLIVIERELGETCKVHPTPDPAEQLERKLCPPDPGIVAFLTSGQITMKSTFADLVRVLSGVENAKAN